MMSDKKGKKKQEFVKLYVPELMQLMESGDEKACLMMAQIEYWFGVQPSGFYKFMTPPKEENSAYHEGDSWTEEMGMSKDKINNALKPLCTQYKSFTEYKKATDKFKDKFYCSYYHKLSHRTYYFRNHQKTNEALKSLSLENKSSIFREKHSLSIGKQTISTSGEGVTTLSDLEQSKVVYTENNAKNITEIFQRESDAPSKNDSLTTEEVNGTYEVLEEVNFPDNLQEDVFAKIDATSSVSTRNGKTPFPANFELTEQMLAWAKAKKPSIDVQHSTEKFKIYYRGEMKDDWLRAWRMWILREDENKKSGFDQDAEYRKLFSSLN